MPMRQVLTFLALVLLPFSAAAEEGPTPFSDIPVTKLATAFEDGLVSGGGEKAASYRHVMLVLQNRTDRRLVIDVAGGFLRPRTRGSTQRLGIGPSRKPNQTRRRGSGTILVHLEPAETRRMEMSTVCLDAGRPAPSGQDYDIADARLPSVREKVLRWWADNPEAPQYAVNSAIWQNRDKVVIPTRSQRPPKLAAPTGHAGTVFRLRGGELLSTDPDGLTRFLGTGIYRAFPTENGVFAVALGEHGARELWRMALTGKNPWSRLATLDETSVIRDVFPVGKAVIVVRAQGLDLLRSGQRTTVLSDPTEDRLMRVSAWPAADGRVLVVVKDRGDAGFYQGGEKKAEESVTIRVSALDPKTGALKEIRRFWNIRDAAVGPAGIFALSHGANLRSFVGKSFKTLGPNLPWRGLVAVGRKHLWVQDRQEYLALISARTGSVVKRFKLKAPAVGTFSIDRATDDFLYIHGNELKRISASTGDVTRITSREERD